MNLLETYHISAYDINSQDKSFVNALAPTGEALYLARLTIHIIMQYHIFFQQKCK